MEWYDCRIAATIGCMQQEKRELERLIEKYISGQITDVERAHLMQWLRDLDVAAGSSLDGDAAKLRMKERIDARLLPAETAVRRAPVAWKPLLKIVAAALLCFSFAWYLWEDRPGEEPVQTISAVVNRTPVRPGRMSCTVLRDSTLILEDGSKVRLLAHSTLTWMQPFPQGQRAIQLQGKAFFEVAHDTARPFTVLAGNILTTALGTSFWVSQETKDAKPEVRLITGRVSIKERDQNGKERLLAYLTPGQTWNEPAVQPKKEPFSKMQKPVEEVIQTSLVFHHKPLAEVLPAIASFYRTSILFSADQVSGLSFYGTYTRENDVGQILQTICLANDLELRFNNETNTYTIIKNSP